ncbi:hypothetical protein MTR67_028769 [Solanum verrucosum]|uniref:Uncharacterized protein n=1 Tax=Solanum verrucosum TaxID=315347 RepID=A0AAF0R319_SOLVR|nr:hypothetical protein MTR67_028769 [Solanum verrucosum]
MDLRTFLKWAAIHLGYSFSTKIVAAPPTAEVEPIHSNYSQVLIQCTTAEVEPIRSNYSQTCRRIISSTGFVVLDNLLNHIAESVLQMGTKLTRAEVADKVKYYSIPSIDGQGRLAQSGSSHSGGHIKFLVLQSYVIHPKTTTGLICGSFCTKLASLINFERLISLLENGDREMGVVATGLGD